SRRRHTRFSRDWSSDVCSSDLVRIFENNILQFLQNNQLQDVWDLEAVGRVIFQKDIDLQQMAGRDNQYVWTRYALDLSQLVNLRSEERRVGKERTCSLKGRQ